MTVLDTPTESAQPDDGDDVRWNVDTMVEPFGGMQAALDDAARRAEAFQARRGTIATLSAAELAVAMAELADLREISELAVEWAMLRQSTDMDDPQTGADVQRGQEQLAKISSSLVFFDLEWAALDDAHVDRLLADPALALYEHHLRVERSMRDHLLSEQEETVMARKAVTGSSAWVRLFEEQTTAIRVDLPDVHGEGTTSTTLPMSLARMSHPDRAVRQAAHAAITDALQPGLRTRAYIFNTLLADKATDDELRRFSTWVSSRNLSNEASDESVEALVAAVQSRYDLPQRWYALKGKVLGIDRMADYDRYAAIADDDVAYGFNAAREIVLASFAEFSPGIADVARKFFDEGWIDAGNRPGKRGGAFCAYTVPRHHPYVFLNWTSQRSDVLTMAHELGHGVHAYLARQQSVFSQSTPLTLAETASVFGETLTFGALLREAPTAADRLSLLASSIEGAIATVFRQTAMNRFEHAVHTARRSTGELSVEEFNEHWATTQADLFGPTMEVTPEYRSWWSYIPHFIGSPGYVYAYSYGQLLALSVYRQSEIQGGDFRSRYEHMLAAGGSLPPEELGRIVGCDLADPSFWNGGLSLIEVQIDAAETAASEAGLLG